MRFAIAMAASSRFSRKSAHSSAEREKIRNSYPKAPGQWMVYNNKETGKPDVLQALGSNGGQMMFQGHAWAKMPADKLQQLASHNLVTWDKAEQKTLGGHARMHPDALPKLVIDF